MPAHNLLWRECEKSSDNVTARLAVIPLVQVVFYSWVCIFVTAGIVSLDKYVFKHFFFFFLSRSCIPFSSTFLFFTCQVLLLNKESRLQIFIMLKEVMDLELCYHGLSCVILSYK